ncbi:MAG: oligosaccharide flippase family protein, partial [Burkholderiales bacterium]|nr:oligosaccharide flippase family protein [Burkholderiales bacterium]
FFVVLGRMLDPSMFGLVAMVMVIGQFAKMFADAGLGGALIQRKRVTQLHYHTIFWLNLAVGFGGALVVLLSAP